MTARSQTFRLGKYRLDLIDGPMRGLCETPGRHDALYMMIPNRNTQEDLGTIIHEAMHAEGIPDRYLHGEVDGRDSAAAVAKLLWRLGWRKTTGTSQRG